MSDHPINGLMDTTLEKIKQMVKLFEIVHEQNPMPIRY